MRRLTYFLTQFLIGTVLTTLNAQVLLSEFQAANIKTLRDEDRHFEDWIEVCNVTATNVNLAGWSLTDDPNQPRKWQFPSTNLGPGKFLVVFASNKDRRIPGAPLHTNFRLSSEGEYLALVRPDANSIATEYSPAYPPQANDVSYGLPWQPKNLPLIEPGAAGKFLAPSDATAATDWAALTFDDSGWNSVQTGVGFDVSNPPALTNLILNDVAKMMYGSNATAYLRIPFVVDDPTPIDQLVLSIRYNDGFEAYLNGTPVVARNAPAASEPLAWNSSATGFRTPEQSSQPEQIDVSASRKLLLAGTNILAIQGLNVAVEDPNFLLLPELIATVDQISPNVQSYFTSPTPGNENGLGSTTLGPIVTEIHHTPQVPQDGEDLTVTARVTPSLSPVASVTLKYRIMYGGESAIPMADDGNHGDGLAGDGVYAAQIPAVASIPGQMIRYYIVATDDTGRNSRAPTYLSATRSPQYFGTVVSNPILTNSLPVIHWFIQNPNAADTDAGGRCSIFFADEFYDNVAVSLHGQSTRGFPKRSYDLDFNPGYKFRWSPDAPRVGDINLLTTWGDKTHMRNQLAHETYLDGGAPGHFAFPVRIQQNRAFYSVANLVESGDDDFLTRIGLDPQGALYKMYNSADSVSLAEKKTRRNEGTADLQALINGMRQSNLSIRRAFMFDNLNIPEVIDFFACRAITADADCCGKNYYLYRDTRGTGEWQAMPWDVDLSFGRVWTCNSPCYEYFDPNLYTNQGIFIGYGNTVFTPFYDTPATRQMYLRRLRTLMDQLLQPPGIQSTNDGYRLKTERLRDQIGPDAALDLAKWGTWGNRETITQAVNRIWNEFLPGRRAYLYRTMSAETGGQIPAAQPTDAVVDISGLEYRPTNGTILQQWVSLTNGNTFAVDISNWQLEGGVRFKFRGGTVVPARSAIFVSPNPKSFRTRTTSPKGGEQRLVVGPCEGVLSAWGESLSLTDPLGRQVSTKSYIGNPSAAQQYLRITKLFYHPDLMPGNPNLAADAFEFVELRNIGPTNLDMHGVRFTEGILFDFNAAGPTNLAGGESILLVRDTNAFALRYGSDMPVVGQFAGKLDDQGERLRLEDGYGQKILDFSYDPQWYPLTDGLGYCLAIVDAKLSWSLWSEPSSWKAGEVPDPNKIPRPGRDSLLVKQGITAKVSIGELLANDFDPGGQKPRLVAVDTSSRYGARIELDSGTVQYTPVTNFLGNDSFGYIISNGLGFEAMGRVDVYVYRDTLPSTNQLSLTRETEAFMLEFRGPPGRVCQLQRSTNLLLWETLLEVTIPTHGIVSYTDSAPPPKEAFYRARLP